MEQRYQAVLDVVNDGLTLTDVARRHGVARQAVHGWLRRYAASGLAGLADQTSKAVVVPTQIAAPVEARIVGLISATTKHGNDRHQTVRLASAKEAELRVQPGCGRAGPLLGAHIHDVCYIH